MVYINKLYTIFTNAFSCIKTNSILFTVPMFLQVAIIPQYSSILAWESVSLCIYRKCTHEYKQVTWNSTQKIDLFVFQNVYTVLHLPFRLRGNTVLCNEKMPIFYPKWHKNDYQNEPCYTGGVYTESNFSPRFIELLFSAQNTKVKKVFNY